MCSALKINDSTVINIIIKANVLTLYANLSVLAYTVLHRGFANLVSIGRVKTQLEQKNNSCTRRDTDGQEGSRVSRIVCIQSCRT